MIIEILAEEEWESTKWDTLIGILVHPNVERARVSQDAEYYYLVCLYESKPEVYRLKKR